MNSSQNPKVYNRLIELIRDPYVVVTLNAIQTIEQRVMDEESAASPDATTARPIAMRVCVSDIDAGDAIMLDRLGCLDAKFLSMFLADIRLGILEHISDYTGLPYEIAVCMQERRALGFSSETAPEIDIEMMRQAGSGYHLSRRIIELSHFTTGEFYELLRAKSRDDQTIAATLVNGCVALAPFILETRQKFPQHDKLIEAFKEGFKKSLNLAEDQPQVHERGLQALKSFEADMLEEPKPVQTDSRLLHPVVAQNAPEWKSRFRMKPS